MTTTTVSKTCASCTHWAVKSDDNGECRVRAPQLIAFRVDDETEFVTSFPETAATDWCGEFAEK